MQYQQAMSRILWAILRKYFVAEGFLIFPRFVQISTSEVWNVGLSSSNLWKLQIIGKNLAIRYKSPGANFFIQNLVWGRESHLCNLVQNFTILALETWAEVHQSRNNVHF